MITHYILAVVTIFLYLYSFFPVSQNFSQKHELPSVLLDLHLNKEQIYKSDIEKVVIVIIDALRYDFITYNNTPNLITLLGYDGCLSKVKVEAPTVTLPRIKSLTTGTVPQFIDVLLNVLDTESAIDSMLHQAVYSGKKIIFYGDDTWLKLYPDMFLRSEGTSSFYVHDFYEVDSNVTVNMRQELLKNDWNIMILHYLGLDHIGHVTGPYSSLIGPKLKEMDNIVKEIHDSIESDAKLIVITGDHGMKDSGGHGGTTYSETRVPFVLLGRKCLHEDELAQSDIPMLLSVFLGLPFPSNSIGKLSSKLLSSLPLEKLLFNLRYNAIFLQNKTDICSDIIDRATQMHYDFLKSGNISAGNVSIHLYESCLKDMSSYLVHSSVVQNDSNLILCIFTLLFCLIEITRKVLYKSSPFSYVKPFVFIFILSSFVYNWNKSLIIFASLFIFLHTVRYMLPISKQVYKLNYDFKIVILIILNILHSISMLSSSFIEEEHQTWYFFFATVLIIFFIKNCNFYSIILLIYFSISRKLNQTGDKWAAEPDITQWLLMNNNYVYLHTLCITSLILLMLFSVRIFYKNNLCKFLSVFTFILIYFFKMFALNNVVFGQVIWLLIFINFFLGLKTPKCSLVNTWILIIALLYRPQNLILIPFCIFASLILFKHVKSKLVLSILHLWIGNVLYFCQGHSNSLANIDIAVGYIGLENYKPTYVLLQILCHTYSMPILANLLLLKHHNDLEMWNVSALSRLLLVTITFTLSFIQRHHLFIWSVFAPKILLETSHTIVLLIQMLLHYFFVYINKSLNKTD